MKFLFLTVLVTLIIFSLFASISCEAKKNSLKKTTGSITKSKNKGIYFYRTYVTRYSRLCSYYVEDPYACISVSYCGWCQARRTCVPGSFYGPLYSRLCPEDNYYIYEAPVAVEGYTWDPWATSINLRWNRGYRRYYVYPARTTTVSYS